MPNVIPRYVFVIDWDDQIAPLPYNHPNALIPIDFDFTGGAQLQDFSRMVGLYGVIRVHDPEGELDPITKEEGSRELERLSFPHRFWMYALDSEPIDSTIRQEGFAVVDRRQDKDHARIRLVSKEFVRLRSEVSVQPFNTYSVFPPPPPDIRRTTVTRPQSEARVNSIQLDGFNESFTEANLSVFYKNGDPDRITGGVGFQVTDIYIAFIGATDGSLTVPVTESPTSFTIPVTPGGVYVVRGDVLPELDKPYTTAPFTVPTLDVGDPPTINLSVTKTDTTASIIATVTNPPGTNPIVDFVIGSMARDSEIAGGQAFAEYSGLSPGTTYEVTATIRGTTVSRSSMFTTAATPIEEGEGGEVTRTPDVEIDIASFSVQVLSNTGRIRITGRVTDRNDADGTLSGLTVFQTYRLATSNTAIGLAGATTDANGNFSSDHTIQMPTTEIYVVQAVVQGGSVQPTANFQLIGTAVGVTTSLQGINAVGTGATTARLSAQVANPTSAGTVWFGYRRQGTTSWTTTSVNRPANVGFVTTNISGLSPSTSYEVQGTIALPMHPRAASFTTSAVVQTMNITFAGATNIEETSATMQVSISNVPSGTTPVVSFSVGGRVYSALASLSLFSGWQASFNVTGLTEGTSYAFTVTAAAGTQRDTETVSFTTQEQMTTIIFPEVSRLTASSIVRTSFAVIAAINFGRDEDGRPFSGTEVTVEWQYRQQGTPTWIPAGRSRASLGAATGRFGDLLPLTNYQVRARVIEVRGKQEIRSWVSTLVRTGKVTAAGLARWRNTLNNAKLAQRASQALLDTSAQINQLLRNMDAKGQDVINAANPIHMVATLRSIQRDAEELERIANTLDSLESNLQETISNYETSARSALLGVGVTSLTAGAIAGLVVIAATPTKPAIAPAVRLVTPTPNKADRALVS